MKYRILLFFLFFLAVSCVTVEVCDESNESDLVVRFKTLQDGVAVDSTLESLTLYGIKEGENDTLYNLLPTSGFLVPLDPHNDISRYSIQINGQSDTLTVTYNHESYMISYTCGFGNLFNLETISYGSGIIKGDTILNGMVDAEYEEDEEHIWLYL